MSFLGPVGLIISAVSSLGQMFAGARAGAQNERLARQIGDIEAKEIREDTTREVEAAAQERRRLLGTQRVRAAAAGVSSTSGSPLDVQLETLSLARQELDDILISGQRRERTARITAFGRVQQARSQTSSAIFTGLGNLGSLATRSASFFQKSPKPKGKP